MSLKKCICSNFFDDPSNLIQEDFCIADECILNEPKLVTQAEAEKIGFELQQYSKDRKIFTPAMMVLWVLNKFNIKKREE